MPRPIALEERAQQHRRRRPAVGERVLEQQHVARQHLGGDRVDQRVLRAELVEDGGARDAGRLRHVRHRDVVQAALGEEPARRLEDGRARVARAGSGIDLAHWTESITIWTRVHVPPDCSPGWESRALGRRLGRADVPLLRGGPPGCASRSRGERRQHAVAGGGRAHKEDLAADGGDAAPLDASRR